MTQSFAAWEGSAPEGFGRSLEPGRVVLFLLHDDDGGGDDEAQRPVPFQ